MCVCVFLSGNVLCLSLITFTSWWKSPLLCPYQQKRSFDFFSELFHIYLKKEHKTGMLERLVTKSSRARMLQTRDVVWSYLPKHQSFAQASLFSPRVLSGHRQRAKCFCSLSTQSVSLALAPARTSDCAGDGRTQVRVK